MKKVQEKTVANLLKVIDALRGDVVTAPNTKTSLWAKTQIMYHQLRLTHLCQFKNASALYGLDPVLKHAVIHNGTLSVADTGRKLLRTMASLGRWSEAKAKNDFTVVAPAFQKLIDTVREEAKRKADILGVDTPYDAQIDQYTRGLRLDDFDAWERDLIPFCQEAYEHIQPRYGKKGGAYFPCMGLGDREVLGHEILRKLRLDFSKANVGNAPHPVCFGVGDRVSIGLHLDHSNIWSSYSNVFHEGMHAVYRSSIPSSRAHPIHQSVAGAGMDESMALIGENYIADSAGVRRNFARFLRTGMGANITAEQLHDSMFTPANLYEYVPSQDVRYMLNIILRKRVEEVMLNTDIAVKDIPDFRAQEYKALFGADEHDPARGVMRTIHNFGGYVGWIPAYLFGNLGSHQIMAALKDQEPKIVQKMDDGRIGGLLWWLNKNISAVGAQKTAQDIIRDVTDKPLGVDAYKAYTLEHFF